MQVANQTRSRPELSGLSLAVFSGLDREVLMIQER